MDCGKRFLSLDLVRLQIGILSLIVVGIIGGIGFWAVWREASLAPDADSADWIGARPAVVMSPDFGASDANPAIRQAAENGDPNAQYQLGLAIVQRHWERGSQSMIGDATTWIRRAAERNHARAQFVLGALYQTGRGVIQDDRQAIEWYRRAAGQGDALAMTRLGRMIELGIGVAKNPVEAYAWLNLATARGDTYAIGDRDDLRRKLAPEQLVQAQERSRVLDAKLPRLTDDSRPLPRDF